MRPGKPIVIAGAGIGGLTAALALRAHDLPVEVYDRRTAEEIRTAAGSGLTIWSNASTVLGWLGLGERLLAASAEVHAIRNSDPKGNIRFNMSTDKHRWPDSLPSVSVGRMDLAEILMGAARERGVPVHYGQAVEGFEVHGDEVEVHLADGGRVEASALVGADGIRSGIHTRLRGEIEAKYLGRTTYRGVVPGADGLVPNVPLLFHDSDTGYGGGVYPIGFGRAAWTLSYVSEPGQRDEPGQVRAQAEKVAAGLPAVLRERVARTPDEAIIRTDVWYHVFKEGWGSGPVTLLGDAAHAMPNDLGQGACQAVEDGVVLADALGRASDVVSGLRAYEQRRYERVKWVHEQSVIVATAPEIKNPVLGWVMGKATRLYLAMAEKGMWRRMQQPPELSAPEVLELARKEASK